MPRQNIGKPPVIDYFMLHELCNPGVIFKPASLQHDRYEVLCLHDARLRPLKSNLFSLLDCFFQQRIEDRKELFRTRSVFSIAYKDSRKVTAKFSRLTLRCVPDLMSLIETSPRARSSSPITATKGIRRAEAYLNCFPILSASG